MKNLTMRWMFAAAALVVAAGSASAQTYNAEIPMVFRVGDTVLEPGSYQIRVTTGANKVFYVRNLETRRSVAVLGGAPSDAPKGWVRGGKPKIAFECAGGTCALSRLWNGQDTFAYSFHVRKLPTIEARRMEVVTMSSVR